MPSFNTLVKLIKLILLSLLILYLLDYDVSTIALPLPSFQTEIRRLAAFWASRTTAAAPTVVSLPPTLETVATMTSLPAASSLETVATVVNAAAAGGVVVRLICLSCALAIFITYHC